MPSKQRHRNASKRRTKAESKISVSIVGAGRVGTALGIALERADYAIDAVVAKHSASARRAAQLIGAGTAYSWTRFAQQKAPISRSQVLIIATPDDVLRRTVDELASLLCSSSAHSTAKTAFHTSGALSSDVLSPLRKLGYKVASLHPLLSISDPRTGADRLSAAFFSLEGDAAAKRVGQTIVHGLGAQSFSISADDKALYHAAALMASPNLTALFDIALEMLSRCGLSSGRARKVLLPLVQSTLDNLNSQAPSRALTG